MASIFDKLRSLRDKKRYEVILHDRTHLTDYEKDVLIPELKSRLGALKQYFKDIIEKLISSINKSEI